MPIRLTIVLDKELVKKLYELKTETRIPVRKLVEYAVRKFLENPNIEELMKEKH
ncbi:MAG: ribbon-helix-helix domain-containing protein [Sulfolobales archaeon]